MPTYTYRCTKCGAETEAVQAMSDPPLKRCRACRGKLMRTFHPVGIVLKGPGFHKTDYASKSRKAGQSSDKTSESKSSEGKGSDTKSSDSKSSPGSEKSKGSSTSKDSTSGSSGD